MPSHDHFYRQPDPDPTSGPAPVQHLPAEMHVPAPTMNPASQPASHPASNPASTPAQGTDANDP